MSLRVSTRSGATSLDVATLETIFGREMANAAGVGLFGGTRPTVAPVRQTPSTRGRELADLAVRTAVPRAPTGGSEVQLFVFDRGSYRHCRLRSRGYGAVSFGTHGRRLLNRFFVALAEADPALERVEEIVLGCRAIARDGRDLGEVVGVDSSIIRVDGAFDSVGGPITQVFRSDLDLAATRVASGGPGRVLPATELVVGCRAIGRDGRDYGEITKIVSSLITVKGEVGDDGEPITQVFRSDLDLVASIATAPEGTGRIAVRHDSSRYDSIGSGTFANEPFDTGSWSTDQLREVVTRLNERGIEPTLRDGLMRVSDRALTSARTVVTEVIGEPPDD